MKLFAVAAPGLEAVLHDELREVGITKARAVTGGVEFRGGSREMMLANLLLRTASRVLLRVGEFHAESFHELERRLRRIQWSDFVGAGSVVRVRVTCRKSRLYHSDAVAERFARALADAVGATVVRGSADEDDGEVTADSASDESNPTQNEQMFVLRIDHDECVLSVDSSGEPLYKRGYRLATSRAPIRETLAAAVIRLSGWRPGEVLLDPLCGSGTIPIEAALMQRNIAPGLARADRTPRPFAFERWKDFDAALWASLVDAARARIRDSDGAFVFASDRDSGALQSTASNALRAGVGDDVQLREASISELHRVAESGAVVCNPPYGKRVGDEKSLRNLYARFGDILRNEFQGWSLTMLAAAPALERQMRLHFASRWKTFNGGIAVSVVRAVVPGAVVTPDTEAAPEAAAVADATTGPADNG